MNESKLKYTSRDYKSIRTDLVEAINATTQNWTSREDSDPGIVLLNLMSYLGDNLSFNLDMQAQEMYLPTVTQRKNIKKLLALVGYKLHWYRSGIVTVTISNNTSESIRLDTNIQSPNSNNRLVTSTGNMNYTILPLTSSTSTNVINVSGHESITLTAVQGTVNSATIDVSNINNNRFYIPNSNVDEAHLYLYWVKDIGSDSYDDTNYSLWTLVNDLDLQTTSGDYFEFDTDDYDRPYIQLPSYWKERISASPSDVSPAFRLYYIISDGANGNVTDNAFYTIYNTPSFLSSTPSDTTVDITITNKTNWNANDDNNCPGYDPQTAEEARKDVKNYINTYDTLVTISDFEKFIRRQVGFNASVAIDVQRAKDINRIIYENYLPNPLQVETDMLNNQTRIQKYVCGKGFLLTTTPSSSNEDVSTYTYRNITTNDLSDYVINPIPTTILNEDKIDTYKLNIYCIYDNYNTDYLGLANPDEWNSPLNSNNTEISLMGITDPTYPYRRYRISDEVIYGTSGISGIMEKLQNTKIMNVDVEFATCRVFDWRAVGTIYLRNPVIEDEAKYIIDNVVRALEAKFTPEYVGFGQKISYIEVIDTIQNADSRIRYFDAGRGNKKLVDWSTQSFDVDGYFNAISIMRFNQYSVPNNYTLNIGTGNSAIPQYNMDEQGNELLTIDSSCIINY